MRLQVCTLLAAVGCAGKSPTNFSDGGADTPAVTGMTYTWTFDEEPGEMPSPWFNVLGDWQIEDGTVVQTGEHPSPDYPRVLYEGLQFSDLSMSVKCRMEWGVVDRACGLVFRAVDSDNYFITRANVQEDNIRLYRVFGGKREQFASVDIDVGNNTWHLYEVEAIGNHILIKWNGETVIDATNDTFTTGVIGLWTKADSIARFDDLTVTAR